MDGMGMGPMGIKGDDFYKWSCIFHTYKVGPY